MRDEENMEAEIQAKGLNAPRLTPAMIDGKIATYAFHVFPGTSLTICAITLINGFQVTGESASASLENFDREIGEKIAFEKAREKIWMLEGYLLREHLAFKSGLLHAQAAYRDAGTGHFTTEADAKARPNETVRDTFTPSYHPAGTILGARRSTETITRDLSTNSWRNEKGELVPDSEVIRDGDRHVRMVVDTDLGGVSGKTLGHDRTEEGAPNFKD